MAGFVQSVENLTITVTGASNTGSLTKSQTAANCIPFVTGWSTAFGGDDKLPDVGISGSTVTVTRGATGGTLEVHVSVVEFATGTLTSGTVSITGGNPSNTASISLSDIGECFLYFTSQSDYTGTIKSNYRARGEITDASTLTFERVGTTNDIDITYYVWEAGSSEIDVQRGSIDITAGNSSNTASVSSVTTADSMLLGSWALTLLTGSQFHRATTLELTNSTTVTAERGGTTGTTETGYQVIESQGGELDVQRGEIDYNSSATAAISAVDADFASVHGTVNYGGGRSTATQSNDVDGRLIFNSTTEIELGHNFSSTTHFHQWEVVEWTEVSGGAIAGSASFDFAATGTLGARGALAGSAAFDFDTTGTLGARGALAGAASFDFAATGTLSAQGAIAGSASFDFDTTGTLGARGALAGAASFDFDATATALVSGAIAGTASFDFDATGTLEPLADTSYSGYSASRPLTLSRLDLAGLGGRPLGTYLLTIRFAGRAWRWSSRPLDIPTRNSGLTYRYGGGLDEVDVARQVEALQDSPELLRVSAELDWDGVAGLIGAGHDLTAASGELALIWDGDVWEDRLILLDGPVSQPEYGYDGDPVNLSVIEAPFLDRALHPEPTARVTTETWPSAPEDSEGLWYPQVFGEPGNFQGTDGAALEVPGSPAIVVDYDGSSKANTLLVNGSPAGTTAATLWYDGATVAAVIATSTDGLGRSVATVDISGAIEDVRLASNYYIIWTSGGATLDDRTGSPITGAGALARWWLDRSTLRVDDGRWAAIQRFLDRYRIAGYVDEQVTPWDLIADNLLKILPLSIVAGPDGLRPVVWDWRAGRSSAVETIRAEAGTVLDGLVAYTARPQELVSEARVSWAVDDEARTHRRVTTCSPERDSSDPDSHSSVLARTSGARAAGGQIADVDSDWIQDEATAWLVAVDVLAVQGFASRTATYETTQERAWLEEGDVVVLEDTALSVDGVALVTGWQFLEVGRVLLTLTLPGQPLRDSRSTGPDPTDGTFDDPGGT